MSSSDMTNGHDLEIHVDHAGHADTVTLDGHPLHLAELSGVSWEGDKPQTVTVQLVARTVHIHGGILDAADGNRGPGVGDG